MRAGTKPRTAPVAGSIECAIVLQLVQQIAHNIYVVRGNDKGAVGYALDLAVVGIGQIKRVANSTFIITPYNVDIMGDLLDELESNGAFY